MTGFKPEAGSLVADVRYGFHGPLTVTDPPEHVAELLRDVKQRPFYSWVEASTWVLANGRSQHIGGIGVYWTRLGALLHGE